MNELIYKRLKEELAKLPTLDEGYIWQFVPGNMEISQVDGVTKVVIPYCWVRTFRG